MLKDSPRISILLTRDSVCAGDDCDAPHAKKINIYSIIEANALASEMATGYLPNVSGDGHYWTCILNGIEIADVRSDGTEAKVKEVVYQEENNIHFVYKYSKF